MTVPDPRQLRCSDTDRERVAEALREAAGEGRLTLAELEERLDAAFKARTYGDLQPITHDLPQGPYPVPGIARRPNPPAPTDEPSAPAGTATDRVTAVLGEEKRRGRWEVSQRQEVTCFLGEVTLDFSEAIVRHREVVVQVAAVLGSVTLIIPEGIDVRLEPGTTILGERNDRLTGNVTPGGPICWVRGFIILGSLTVRPPKQRRSRLDR